MLQLELRDKNYIVTCTSPGKTPLKGRRGSSLYQHSPLDFLLAALGTCSGGEIVDYCRLNDLNVEIFELISVSLIDDVFTIYIKYPKDLDSSHLSRIETKLKNCTISQYFSKSIEVNWEAGNIPIKKIINREKMGCCGQ